MNLHTTFRLITPTLSKETLIDYFEFAESREQACTDPDDPEAVFYRRTRELYAALLDAEQRLTVDQQVANNCDTTAEILYQTGSEL